MALHVVGGVGWGWGGDIHAAIKLLLLNGDALAPSSKMPGRKYRLLQPFCILSIGLSPRLLPGAPELSLMFPAHLQLLR
jgi:hypothetical protein